MVNIELQINKVKKKLLEKIPEIKTYYLQKVKTFAPYTQYTNLLALLNFFETVNKYTNITEDDVEKYLDSEYFRGLKDTSQKTYLDKIRKYFNYNEREDLSKLLPRIKLEATKISKNDLYTRDDLSQVLSICTTKQKALVMVNFEGALRKGELINILYKDMQFNKGYATLYVRESKTKTRPLPLIESVPYLIAYFSKYSFTPDEKIFNYTASGCSSTYEWLLVKVKKHHPQFNKELFPHILRHSRMYELAKGKLSLHQLEKFGGWAPGSNMPQVYFHLDSDDILNILTEGAVETEKPRKFEPKQCPICTAQNAEQNAFCWKCNYVFDEKRFIKQKLTLEDEMQELREMYRKIQERVGDIEELTKKK